MRKSEVCYDMGELARNVLWVGSRFFRSADYAVKNIFIERTKRGHREHITVYEPFGKLPDLFHIDHVDRPKHFGRRNIPAEIDLLSGNVIHPAVRRLESEYKVPLKVILSPLQLDICKSAAEVAHLGYNEFCQLSYLLF